MTKREKKQAVNSLATEFLNSTDVNQLIDLQSQIIKEVATCGYDPQSNVVPLSLDMWAKDLTAYIAAVQNNTVDAELKRFTELSLIGIINLIDLSQLHA